MYLFQRILRTVRGWFYSRRDFDFDVRTLESLRVIAEREQRTPQEVAAQLVDDAMRHQERINGILVLWELLSPREQQVAALICLGYTNRQIAQKLRVSPETIKTHVAHILMKFNLPNREELRRQLVNWDFREWEENL